jgi:hypothetical protein
MKFRSQRDETYCYSSNLKFLTAIKCDVVFWSDISLTMETETVCESLEFCYGVVQLRDSRLFTVFLFYVTSIFRHVSSEHGINICVTSNFRHVSSEHGINIYVTSNFRHVSSEHGINIYVTSNFGHVSSEHEINIYVTSNFGHVSSEHEINIYVTSNFGHVSSEHGINIKAETYVGYSENLFVGAFVG